jgi:hypothetical protein
LLLFKNGLFTKIKNLSKNESEIKIVFILKENGLIDTYKEDLKRNYCFLLKKNFLLFFFFGRNLKKENIFVDLIFPRGNLFWMFTIIFYIKV